MKRLAMVFVVLGGCGGKHPPATGAGSGSAPALYAKKLALGFGIAAHGDSADVFLQTTDETGKQTSYPLGTYPGPCKVIVPAADMKAASGVGCAGVELDAVTTDTEIIILKGKGTDPMARDEVTRVKAAGGAKIEAGG